MESEIHLSVVATSRNDNHGGFLTQRMQHFVDGLVAQCKRHGLQAELILVEWNPPAERKPLAEELSWPVDCAPCEIRIITVPRETHAALPHGDKLPLYQMIAKNVGIRRARGRFVLATNIDILFSDEVIRMMRDRLQPDRLYRADRRDVPTHVPDGVDFDQVLEFCRREQFRLNATGFTLVRRDGRWDPASPLAAMLRTIWKVVKRTLARGAEKTKEHSTAAATAFVERGASVGARLERSSASVGRLLLGAWNFVRGATRMLARLLKWVYQALIRRELFTNACGDFTLLARADWFALRGYPEWPVYSMHIDSILLYQAHRSRIREIYLGEAAAVYHIEHAPGSGFTPESSDKLFDRLTALGIPFLDWEKDAEPLIAQMYRKQPKGGPVTCNDDAWGYAGQQFAETRVGVGGRRP